MKRIISILAALCLLLTMMPMSVFARTTDPTQEWEIPVQVNPLYADVLDRQEAAEKLAAYSRPNRYFGEPVYVSEEEAVQQLRDQMKIRNTSVSLYVQTTNPDFGDVHGDIFEGALEHTGVPTEGDYLAWQYGAIGGSYGGYSEGDVYYMTLNYSIMYYNDAAQEAELNAAVDALLDILHLDGLTDYEKVCGIYKYMTENIVYDYDHLETDPNYYPMYTAYAALVNGTSVCQGYANLFYRLALEVGVDNRIVTGDAGGPHAWNLVEIDGTYYYVDSTWDASWGQAGWDYQWFLKGSGSFSADHQNDPGLTEWLQNYNVSVTDYGSDVPEPSIDWPVSGTCGDNLFWSLAEDGVLTISGTGAMWDYPVEYPGWFQYVDWVRECVIEEGVTYIGTYAFWSCRALEEITVGADVRFISLGAFSDCDRLREVTLPVSVTTIEEGAFDECNSLSDVYYAGSEAQWGEIFIDSINDDLLNANIHFAIIPEVVYGDANGDGGVDTLDLILLRQHFAGWGVTIEDTADANGDGSVNALDLILLRQHLAGWDVTLGKQS